MADYMTDVFHASDRQLRWPREPLHPLLEKTILEFEV
jgi:hypothetical protein